MRNCSISDTNLFTDLGAISATMCLSHTWRGWTILCHPLALSTQRLRAGFLERSWERSESEGWIVERRQRSHGPQSKKPRTRRMGALVHHPGQGFSLAPRTPEKGKEKRWQLREGRNAPGTAGIPAPGLHRATPYLKVQVTA